MALGPLKYRDFRETGLRFEKKGGYSGEGTVNWLVLDWFFILCRKLIQYSTLRSVFIISPCFCLFFLGCWCVLFLLLLYLIAIVIVVIFVVVAATCYILIKLGEACESSRPETPQQSTSSGGPGCIPIPIEV